MSLYLLKWESEAYYVEAKTMSDGLRIWRDEIGESEPDAPEEPESIEIAHENDAIREGNK